MQNPWDIRYSGEDYVYGKEPNTFFKECLSSLPAGKLLLPAEGEGRNAAWAAGKGWKVTAFDQSQEGRRKALLLAQEKSITIDYNLLAVEDFNPEKDEFDAVALVYLHLHREVRIPFHQKIAHCLKPGGRLIVEAFTTKQIGYNSGGPRDLNLLYTPGYILDDFRDFTFTIGGEEEVFLNEGEYHSGKASIIRFFGTKKH
ncbi:class I SAM-dependent methyltransferase [Williamwhitmania taraxaci]|uniref:Methyltransferase domain-containing protein n=1 Tax=Williamwhitmania taraxaci TaxID=1640674 RepID=A0A1G6KQ61_9BACT|nr:class I SAM-dependent methyltransferase [Williamwhitmania taraxaci]SDC32941.1 Methyltransferase domain-containing protein [Williamwhitmania taraxaci]